MLHPSTQQLIRKLCELTETGAIAWKEGENGRCVFDTEGYQVEITADPPSVRLLQGDGRELERADAADLAAAWPDGEGTYATRVADMARHAGRIARGAETAIAKILSSLSAPAKKQPEPEPEPAALAFDAPVEKKAAVEAVTAGLEAQAKKTAEAPPVSHALPDPAPVAVPAETETAIDRVLAVQPPAQPEPPKPQPVVEARPAPQPEPPKPEPKPEPAPAPAFVARPSPRVMDLPPPFADVTMQPPLRPVTASAVMAVPEKIDPAPPTPAAVSPPPKLEPAPAPIVAAAPTPPPAAAKPGFGAIDSFARARPEPKPEPPKPEQPKPAPTSLLMTGISARSNQTVEQSTAKEFIRHAGQPAPRAPAPAAATPTPAPATPAPAPAPEKKLERATTGPDVYKPWTSN